MCWWLNFFIFKKSVLFCFLFFVVVCLFVCFIRIFVLPFVETLWFSLSEQVELLQVQVSAGKIQCNAYH